MGHHVFSLSYGVGHAILRLGGEWVIIFQVLDIEILDVYCQA